MIYKISSKTEIKLPPVDINNDKQQPTMNHLSKSIKLNN